MLKAKWYTFKSEHATEKSNVDLSGQHDPESFPNYARCSAAIMYVHAFLDRYRHLLDDMTRAIPSHASREEGVDICRVTPSPVTVKRRTVVSRETREVVISGVDKFTSLLEPDRHESETADLDMYEEPVKRARAECTDSKYKSKRTLIQLVGDVKKRVAGALDEPNRSQLERYFADLMDELVDE